MFALCKHPASQLLYFSMSNMYKDIYLYRIYIIYTSYMYEFALCAHPASHLLYSRTPNMYMYRYVLYIHHIYTSHILVLVLCTQLASDIYYVHQICVWIHTCAEYTSCTSYICVFALCKHPTSDHAYSRMSNMCMENVVRGEVLAQGKYTCV